MAPEVTIQDSLFVDNMQVKIQEFFDQVHAVGLQEDGTFSIV
ncbi:hypothetical protein SPJ1_1762 [Streptococcus parauberis KRS-02083]|uniref:Uncharacterized protein n=1 Tax=Streptococcus parauberis KRS-02083 TaxID=1207545 RepID=A0ABN0IQ04_9STRE|nr:hypothetical protein SPJ1_1762 [Streptococcus parauberis KRS-02083]